MYMLFNADEVPETIRANLLGLSWSFSHFFLWKGFGILFDCGEQSLRLDTKVFRADVIALSHGHFDHVRGLVGVLKIRAGLMGATEKPLTVLFPADSELMCPTIEEAQQYVQSKEWDHVEFRGIRSGDCVEISGGGLPDAQQVEHLEDDLCLAYRVVRERTRLRAEYRHLAKDEVQRRVREGGRSLLLESFRENEFVYSGDLIRLDPEFCLATHVLMHEASFLRDIDADPEKGWHSTVERAIRCAVAADARSLILWHVSRRYDDNEVRDGVRELISEIGYERPVLCVRGSYNLPTD